ncbi:MAG: hypothetical protein CMO55_27280 [Verrucomicrobiales bacterium]|nr:hypothetical protein [Verrucomicrobiales bacterium]
MRAVATRFLSAVSVWIVITPFFLLAVEGEEKQPEPDVAATTTQVGQEESLRTGDRPLEALHSVLESMELIDAEIQKLNADRADATELEKEQIEAAIAELNTKKDQLQGDFESIATGINPEDYEDSIAEVFVLAEEVDTLLRPIIEELKDLTEKPREIEELRSDLATWKKRAATTSEALLQIDQLPKPDDQALQEQIKLTRQTWTERKKQAQNRIQAISYQLEQAEKNQPSLLEIFKNSLRSFFRSRGRNFLVCILVFFATFFLLRFLHRKVDEMFPWRKKTERPFYVRLIDVGLNLFAFVGAAVAALIVLYATGDWLLMGLAIILLVGLVLAAKNGLPKVYDHARILLNLGEVREGERVIYEGIPWRIDRLNFYTILRNEKLRGGMIRLPVGHLSGFVSRPYDKDHEHWFPCDEGDWILFPEEGLARVVTQTPEYVQVVKLGGAKVTMPTADFLSKPFENLSGSFRISSIFGIDYEHQADSTEKIPEIMWAYMTREICSLIGDRDKLLSLKVEFATAGPSSLDLAIISDFDGSMAAKYQVLQRAIQRMAVDCCNANGWVIPFTQITLHNAFQEEKKAEVIEEDKKPRLP